GRREPPARDEAGAVHRRGRARPGGMGEIYRARDTRLDRVVALKVVAPGLVLDEPRRARFSREARAIARLQHPHICTVHGVGTDETPYLVLEHLDGTSLGERLARGSVPLAEAASWIEQVGRALEYAHGQGVVHRDLKPSNVMMTPSGAKLLDFGLATIAPPPGAGNEVPTMDAPVTATGVVLGTHGYMAPDSTSSSRAAASSA
ncbi:MAG TPA: serine/threonine-protein kinase, partial [Vicinamibacteria bacterium]|nr:serine/threonine-protein kinase [Vicinamibacteria bacterium]